MKDLFEKAVLPAPLAGITNEPFRLLLKNLGYKITWTEMISAEGIVRKQEKTVEMAKIKKEEPVIVAQLFGYTPDTLFEAAKILSEKFGYEYIDINMGCPAKKIIKKKCGVKLMDYPETVEKIFRQLRKLPVKIFAKLRLGTSEDKINFLEIIKILYNEGVDAVTLHPRTGDQFFMGKSNWEHIALAKDTFPDLFLIGNGDIKSAHDIKKMYEKTGCNAVMIGREIAKNPFFINRVYPYSNESNNRDVTIKEKLKLFRTMLHNLLIFYNERIALNLSKKYFILFTKGYPNSSKMRESIIKIKNCIEILDKISYWEDNN